jgi:hypothetical protein
MSTHPCGIFLGEGIFGGALLIGQGELLNGICWLVAHFWVGMGVCSVAHFWVGMGMLGGALLFGGYLVAYL